MTRPRASLEIADRVDVSRDGHAIVRVDRDRPMASNVGDVKSFVVRAMAVIDPIWIDSGRDGK